MLKCALRWCICFAKHNRIVPVDVLELSSEYQGVIEDSVLPELREEIILKPLQGFPAVSYAEYRPLVTHLVSGSAVTDIQAETVGNRGRFEPEPARPVRNTTDKMVITVVPQITTHVGTPEVENPDSDGGSSSEGSRTPIRRRRQFILDDNGSRRDLSKNGTPDTNGNPDTSLNSAATKFLDTLGSGTRQRLSSSFRMPRPKEGSNGRDDKSEETDDQLTSMEMKPLLRSVSLRVKQQLQNSLSDPLKRRADMLGAELKHRKKRVQNISNKLTMPKFLKTSKNSLVSEDVPGGSSSEDDFDDPEFLEQQERDRIIQMYETGPENKDIDSWENPDFDLYKKLDRYGFVHKDGSPASKAEVDQRRRVEREIRREKKWLAMLRQWEGRKPVKKFEERIWKGIPEKLRITLNKRRGEQNVLEEKLWRGLSQKRREFVWPRLLGIEELKRQSKGEKVYSELLVRARLVSKDIKQIDLDINRTYRDHLAFRRRYDVKQQSLLNVLAAYSMYNTEVGYCQGMSQIAALFLMYLDEEDAFWCMHSLMVSPKHAMHGFFVPGFPKLQRFEAHFKKVLKKYKPRVYKHLDKQDIPYIYLTKWWFGCFLDRVPFSLALRLWDTFLLEGDVILTAMALNIMKMHEKSIRKLGIENFMEFIQTSIANDFGYSDDVTMNSLREVLTKLRSDRLHRPPPPDPKDLPEVPTKIFGPVLAKSMADIRSHVAEVHSRCSRANSVATGRTPQTRRRATNRAPPSPTPLRTPSRTDSNSAVNRMRSDPSAGMRPAEKEVPFEVPLRRTPSDKKHWPSTPPPDPRQPTTMTTTTAGQQYGGGRPAMGVPAAGILSQQYQNQNSPNRQQSMSNSAPSSANKSFTMREGRMNSSQGAGAMRQGSTSNDQSPTDGINKNRSSMYDNVSNGGGATMNHRDDVTGKMVTVMRGSDEEDDSRGFNRNRVIPTGETGRHRRAESERSHESAAKVRHAPNNVTYVCIGDDDDGQTSDV